MLTTSDLNVNVRYIEASPRVAQRRRGYASPVEWSNDGRTSVAVSASLQTYASELETAVAAAIGAGEAIRDLYDRAAAAAYTKTDGSPVTDADLASDRIIRARLASHFPDDPILTEEGVDDRTRLASSRCWIVDPLDGTNQYVDRTGEFDVLIALVVDGRPVLGVSFHPPSGLLCAGVVGQGAWLQRDQSRQELRLSPVPAGVAPRLATSIWFGAPATLPALTRAGSVIGASVPETLLVGFPPRLMLLPDRRFDAYLGLPTPERPDMGWEWDFAAADAIIHAAGGVFTNASGHLHQYNKPRLRNTGGLIATSDPTTHALLVDALSPELSTGG